MKIYKQSQVAAKMLLTIAINSHSRINFIQLQNKLGISSICLVKIFNVLSNASLVTASSNNIYSLNKSTKEISFKDINTMFSLEDNRVCT